MSTLTQAALDYSHLVIPTIEFPFRVNFIALHKEKEGSGWYSVGSRSLDEAREVSSKLIGSTIEATAEESKRQAVEEAVKWGAVWLAKRLRETAFTFNVGGTDVLVIGLPNLEQLMERQYEEVSVQSAINRTSSIQMTPPDNERKSFDGCPITQ